MRFSLITATLGRTTELQRLLESLEGQTYRDFELIVVDQNTDDRLVPILHRFEHRLEIRRIRSAPGLSRARNVGLREITGEVVCFPDDDCWYAEDLLDRLNRTFTDRPEWHGVIGESIDQAGVPTLPWPDRAGRLTLQMSWRRSVSYAIFLKSKVICEVGGFDETLGLGSGSPWGSGEDNDLVLRTLKSGFYVHYDKEIRVHHPRIFKAVDDTGCIKRYKYALGDGRLLQNHPMPAWWDLLFFSIPTCRAMLSLARLNAKETYFHWLTFAGRLKGFVAARKLNDAQIPFPLQQPLVATSISAIPAKARTAVSGR